MQPAECIQGQDHDTLSLVPSQFIPPHGEPPSATAQGLQD